jgi:hypothetical protein
MDKLKAALLAVCIVGATAAATEADARGRHHHHHHHRGHVGIWFGAPLFYPHYYPRYYHPPAVVIPAPAPPPVYIEQPQSAVPAPAPTQGAAAYWYYCRDTQTYYPYVQQCATPWEQVVPNSAPAS